uniref:ATP-binding cassette sub-family C member 2-like isoform X2 n=1 Tax=Myxine glutinosa TaxID=7769 RepID=UPI00358E78F9
MRMWRMRSMRLFMAFVLVLWVCSMKLEAVDHSQGQLILVDTEENKATKDDDESVVDNLDEEDLAVFQPTNTWQRVHPGQGVPAGLHVRLNLQTGEREAKLLDQKVGDAGGPSKGDWEGVADDDSRIFSSTELKRTLKLLKDDTVGQSKMDGVKTESDSRQSFRSMEELRKDFEELGLFAEPDSAVMARLLEVINNTRSLLEVRRHALRELEYHVHQVDNAQDLVKLGGLIILVRALNDSMPEIREGSAFVLGSALSSNPQVQVQAVEGGLLQRLVVLLATDHSLPVRKKALFAIATMLRHFPYAQRRFLDLGGISLLSQLLETDRDRSLWIRIVTLAYDMLWEKVAAYFAAARLTFNTLHSESNNMDAFCGSEFWNGSLLDRADPDLTICFEQTVLTWVPIGFLWLCSPVMLIHLWRRRVPPPRNPISCHYVFRQILVCLLLASTVAQLVITIIQQVEDNRNIPPILYLNPLLDIISWLLVLVINKLGCLAEMKTSGVLFIFWLLSVLTGIFPFQTLIRKALNETAVYETGMFSLFFISYGLQFISFIISAFADVPRKESQQLPHGLHKKSPEEDASFLNKLLFCWFDRMVYLGYKKPLEMEDLWELKAKDKADAVSRAFEWNWKAEKVLSRRNSGGRNVVRKASNSSQILDVGPVVIIQRPEKKPSLFKAMINTYYAALLHVASYKVIYDLLSFASPQILKLMISFTTDLSIPEWRGYFYAVLMMASAILQTLLLQQYFHHSFGLGMNIRTTIIGAVYKKALVMSSAAHRASTMGEVVNLMSTDAQRFMDVAANIQLIWSSPLQIILALIFLWIELGPSVLAGLAVMILLIPINALLANKSRGFQVKNMEIKDERIKMMNEILNGIKILKLYAWEPSFGEQVTSVRNAELDVMRSYNYLNSVSIFFFTCAPFLVSLASFGVYLAVDPNNILDAQKAFTSISLFNILRFPLAMLPIIISYLVQVLSHIPFLFFL